MSKRKKEGQANILTRGKQGIPTNKGNGGGESWKVEQKARRPRRIPSPNQRFFPVAIDLWWCLL
jgi:hypothetical protein